MRPRRLFALGQRYIRYGGRYWIIELPKLAHHILRWGGLTRVEDLLPLCHVDSFAILVKLDISRLDIDKRSDMIRRASSLTSSGCSSAIIIWCYVLEKIISIGCSISQSICLDQPIYHSLLLVVVCLSSPFSSEEIFLICWQARLPVVRPRSEADLEK